ncbi:MAG: nitroreductase family protein, partial [Thaumarchaeota archaeon]|nr:nitroreductase family protein [Nitrososphaerota archaeon]
GETPVAIVVCTDLRAAYKGLGELGAAQCSLYDAGAAAENIVLAAYSMGLGASFIKSYSESALASILELPEECRTELVVSVGYPARDEPRPLKKRKGSKITYLDKYGTLLPPRR